MVPCHPQHAQFDWGLFDSERREAIPQPRVGDGDSDKDEDEGKSVRTSRKVLPWSNRTSQLVWRGSTTGERVRNYSMPKTCHAPGSPTWSE